MAALDETGLPGTANSETPGRRMIHLAAPGVAHSAVLKASIRILPLLGLGYLFAYMDRVNIGFAALQMNSELGFSATVYGLGAGMFFLAYSVVEIPSNMLLTRYGARRWLARIMVTWGVLATATMWVRTPWQFYTIRFLLGAAEAGFFPGVIFYLGTWFPKACRGRAISRFYIFGPLASVLLGSVSGTLLSMDGLYGLHGWQWLLALQGLPAVFIGLAIWFFLPNDPGSVGWLTADEKSWLKSTLESEAAVIGSPVRHDLLATIRNPIVLQISLIGALITGVGITFAVNAPLLLQVTTALDEYEIGYVVSAGGVLGIVAMLLTGWFSDRRGERFSCAIASALGMAAGISMIWVHGSAAFTVGGLFIFSICAWSQVLTCAMFWPDLLHPRLLALGGATINTVSQIGAFGGPYAWGIAKDATGTYSAGLAAMAVAMVATTVLLIGLERHVRIRRPSRGLVAMT